jgi:hypothetical protein
MADIIGAIKLPMKALKKVLPIEGATVTVGLEANTKVRYRGEEFLINWTPVVHVASIDKLTEIDTEYLVGDNMRQSGLARRNKAEAQRATFNTLMATPVNDD